MRNGTRKRSQRGGPREPYDERTFRYLLGLEQRRSDRSGRPFVLVLVDTSTDGIGRARIDPEVATTIFSGLSQCLRETDFLGWYEDGRRAGAVLTELGEGLASDSRELINEKVLTRGFLEHLPSDLARRLQIQVTRYPTPDAPQR
jgi:hypothetical protein